MVIAITGGTGFVGKELLKTLEAEGLEEASKIKLLARRETHSSHEHVKLDLSNEFDISSELLGVDTLIHCAARVHVMSESSSNSMEKYLKYNTLSTVSLARQAASAGVRRFIFLSSVKVLGESTSLGEEFRHNSSYNPQDAYAFSKVEAEKSIKSIGFDSGMEITIIRAPLVYGPGVKANFASLLKLAERNLPLPLGSLSNARSLVSISNLVDLIITCINNPKAGNQTFMVSDGEDVSTTKLFSEMVLAFGKKPRLIPCPTTLIRLMTKVVGKEPIALRLLGSLRVDIKYTKETLGWKPKVKLQDELYRCVSYLQGVGK